MALFNPQPGDVVTFNLSPTVTITATSNEGQVEFHWTGSPHLQDGSVVLKHATIVAPDVAK